MPTLGRSVLLVAIAFLLALLPLLRVWLFFKRFSRRKDLIVSLLNRAHSKGGLRAIRPETKQQLARWEKELDLDFRSYVFPTAIASVFAAVGIPIIVAKYFPELFAASPQIDVLDKIPPAAVAGFMGGYIWNLYDLVDRFRILNLPVSSLHLVWFRLLLGPALGICGQSLGILGHPVVVFMVMAFPVAALTKWVQDQAAKRAGIAAGLAADPMWELIQGDTPDIVIRISEAGVANVAHLANEDPVNLLRRTNLEWRIVLDMMDQAYLSIYIGENIKKTRPKGIRGAIEGAVLWGRFVRGDPETRADAEALMKSLTKDLGIELADVKNLLRNLWEDPQVDLIWSLWFERDEAIDSGKMEKGSAEQLMPVHSEA